VRTVLDALMKKVIRLKAEAKILKRQFLSKKGRKEKVN